MNVYLWLLRVHSECDDELRFHFLLISVAPRNANVHQMNFAKFVWNLGELDVKLMHSTELEQQQRCTTHGFLVGAN